MSDDAKTEEERISTLEALHDKLDKFMASRERNPKPAAAARDERPVEDQVNDAVARATERERNRTKAEKEKADMEARFKKLEDSLERAPRAVRRITKVFWGEG